MKKFQGLMILSDLDGTLLTSSGRVSVENAAAIDRFMAEGGLFSVCTGRTKQGMEHFLGELRINTPAIISNGAITYDFEKGCMVKYKALEAVGHSVVRDIIGLFPDAGVEVVTDEGVYIAHMSDITYRHCLNVKVPVVEKNADEIRDPWINMLITRSAEKMPEVFDFLDSRYGESIFKQLSFPTYLEVMAPSAHKGIAARELAGMMGIGEDSLIVAGDGPNDVELLKASSRSFATANACGEAKAAASHVLPSNDENAIAALISLLDERQHFI